MNDSTPYRELDRREGDGLQVTLLWDGSSSTAVVEVFDDVARQMFRLELPYLCARAAFHDPYAYAPTDVLLRAGRPARSRDGAASTRCAPWTYAPAA